MSKAIKTDEVKDYCVLLYAKVSKGEITLLEMLRKLDDLDVRLHPQMKLPFNKEHHSKLQSWPYIKGGI